MNLTGSLEERIKAVIKAEVLEPGKARFPFYELVRAPASAFVVETEKQGEAKIECCFPEGTLCVQWRMRTGQFQFLQEERNADGAFLVQRADKLFEAHVVECKKTVDQKKWYDITRQMRWTLLRIRALAGTLGVELERVVLYTAYRFDKLSPDSTPNPTARKRALGGRPSVIEEQEELNDARRKQLEWVYDEVSLKGFDGCVEHVKIALDEQSGEGKTMLAPARSSTVAQ